MKLRNKQTGEIIIKHLAIRGNNDFAKTYNSLAELNEEWEDYEEPKAYYIERCGTIEEFDTTKDVALTEMLKDIGNYFETEEEAEKAVEKLKAWKRLKDAGFTFNNKSIMDIEIGFIACGKDYDRSREDLDLLFGDEE